MDTVPRLFTEGVQILLMNETDLSGPWASSAFFDRRRTNQRKHVDLYLEEQDSGSEYLITLYEDGQVLSLEDTLLKSYELRTIWVNYGFRRAHFKLDSRAHRALRGFISRNQSVVYMHISKCNDDPDFKTLLDAVPRFSEISYISYTACAYKLPMHTMKVQSVVLISISMTQEMFSQICAFTRNPNFRGVRFSMENTSEISSEAVFDDFWKRFCELQSQGKNAYLQHALCVHPKSSGDEDLSTVCQRHNYRDFSFCLLIR